MHSLIAKLKTAGVALACVAALGTAHSRTIDIRYNEQDFTVYAADPNDRLTTDASWSSTGMASGDVNADGIDDLIIGAPLGGGPGNVRIYCGDIAVVFGPIYPGQLDLRSQSPDLMIYGTEDYDGLGLGMAVADMNADGVSDLILSSQWADGPNNRWPGSGEVYITYGPLAPGIIDFRGTRPETLIYSQIPRSIGGHVLASDVNGDGIADLILGNRAFHPDATREFAGEVFVLPGPIPRNSTIDLETRNDSFRVLGKYEFDEVGMDIAVGDINGDGIGDLIAGTLGASWDGSFNHGRGEVYGFLGPLLPGRIVDLRTQTSDIVIHGAYFQQMFGSSVAAGDINGDRIADVVAGTYQANTLYAFLGPLAPGTDINLATVPADVTIYGPWGNLLGNTVRLADLNGDGIEDIMANDISTVGPLGERFNCGEVSAIYGPLHRGTVLDFSAGDEPDVKVYGADSWDHLGTSFAAGDVDGNGLHDLLIGAPFGAGPAEDREWAGEAYVVLSRRCDGPPEVDRMHVQKDLSGNFAISFNDTTIPTLADFVNLYYGPISSFAASSYYDHIALPGGCRLTSSPHQVLPLVGESVYFLAVTACANGTESPYGFASTALRRPSAADLSNPRCP